MIFTIKALQKKSAMQPIKFQRIDEDGQQNQGEDPQEVKHVGQELGQERVGGGVFERA